MKKLIITGAQGSGKTTFANELSKGKKAIIIYPGVDQTSFFSRVQNENFDFIILEEANGFNTDFVDLILFHDHVLTQNEDATLIAIFEDIPIWAWIFPIYKMECRSYISQPSRKIDRDLIKQQCISFLDEKLLNSNLIVGRDYDIVNSKEVVIKNSTGRATIVIDGDYILYVHLFHLHLFDKIPRIGTTNCHRFKWVDKETGEDMSRVSIAYTYDLEQLISLSELDLNINDIIKNR